MNQRLKSVLVIWGPAILIAIGLLFLNIAQANPGYESPEGWDLSEAPHNMPPMQNTPSYTTEAVASGVINILSQEVIILARENQKMTELLLALSDALPEDQQEAVKNSLSNLTAESKMIGNTVGNLMQETLVIMGAVTVEDMPSYTDVVFQISIDAIDNSFAIIQSIEENGFQVENSYPQEAYPQQAY